MLSWTPSSYADSLQIWTIDVVVRSWSIEATRGTIVIGLDSATYRSVWDVAGIERDRATASRVGSAPTDTFLWSIYLSEIIWTGLLGVGHIKVPHSCHGFFVTVWYWLICTIHFGRLTTRSFDPILARFVCWYRLGIIFRHTICLVLMIRGQGCYSPSTAFL